MTAITALTDPSQLPNQLQDQQTFDANMAYMIDMLPERARQENALAASLNSLAAGGAYAIPYKFSSNTAAGDPGAGLLRLNNALQGPATAMYVDNVGTSGADYSGLLGSFGSSTSPVKGRIRLVKFGDASKVMSYDVIGVTNSTGYYTLTINNAWGSVTTPFVDGDDLMLFFQRTGDMGATGPMNVYPYAHFSEQYASSTSGPATGTNTANRALNTVVANGITGASLSSGAVTLPAGTYEIRATSTVAGNSSTRNQALLRNNTDGSYPLIGSSSGNGSNENTVSHLSGRITIAAQKSFILQTWIGAVASTFGIPCGSGFPEAYANLEVWKLA